MLDANIQDGTPEQRAFIHAHERTGYPSHAFSEPGRLSAFLKLGLPTGYIVATEDRAIEPHIAESFAAKLPGCRRAAIASGHQCMVTRPRELADILSAMAA
jgi:pimeloyl-ACP methyl ester carboxylesterase